MKKLILLGASLLFGGGLALAQQNERLSDDGSCGVSACGGGSVTCCQNGKTGNIFYTERNGGLIILMPR